MFLILPMFLRWKNADLQMLLICLSRLIWLSNMTPRYRALIDGVILLLHELIFRSLKCYFKNEEDKTRNSVLESWIFFIYLFIYFESSKFLYQKCTY